MRVLLAVLHKEFFGYFRNYTSYIVLAIYLVLSFAATFYSADFFDYNNSNLISFFMYQPEILNVVLPAITMKMWADERRQGTLEFLLTQPVSITKLVLGKFLSAFIFGLCMIFMILPFVFYLSTLISYDVLNIISSFIAVILVMGILCALGCTVSAFNNNAIIAYLFSVVIGWVVENTNFDFLLKPLNTIIPLTMHKLQGVLNFRTHYQSMIEGELPINTLIYGIIFIILTLWLNIVVVEKRKS